ncbi:MAG: glycosyltransferase family 4 protein [Candidatus Komeilibacteria bacterium]|jgi:glycosyltransferase involved in cell wall biosynthesis|nr:glycosyltransferase family 4 protein [Candidatus Komeilibacteria bacterium]MBT4447621.1 glycosyltransferase family 4 protein [Candidatus Komeilibacteria bacterium]
MKKILIFSLAYYPHTVSGAEAAIREITDRIDDIEFHMVTLRYNNQLPKTEKIGNVLIHRIGLVTKNPNTQDLGKLPLDLNKPLYQFLAPIKGIMLNRKYKYDAIWSMMAHSAGVPAVIYKMLSPKTKFALTLQEGDPTDYIEKTMKPLGFLFTNAFIKADVVQVISNHLGNWARRQGTKEENIELVHNGANPKSLNPDAQAADLDKLKQKFNKQAADIFLVNTARLAHQKANDNTIQALAKLPNNIKLLLVGDGDQKELLKNLAKKLKLEDRVIFAGRVDRSEISKYRQISDIFVCPSRSEGLGNAFLSAMALRLPVVATREGGLSEFIFDQKTAWVVDKNSPDQIVKAVKNILANPDKVKIITDTAHQMVVKEYNWDLVAKNMRDKVFSKII